MSKLYIVGDSFSSLEIGANGVLHPYAPDDYHYGSDVYWPSIVANKLNLELINSSLSGASQDYCWKSLHDLYDVITPDDYLIIVLTDPNRYWYLQDDPGISKAIELELNSQRYSPDRIEACTMFEEFIQRASLVRLHLRARLAWLANAVTNKKWKHLIMWAFENDQYIVQYPVLNFASGTLASISAQEYKTSATIAECTNFLNGLDPRYNHMCLSNHKILADKIVKSFDNLDLTNGFIQNILTKENLEDTTELSPAAINKRKENLLKHKLWKFGVR